MYLWMDARDLSTPAGSPFNKQTHDRFPPTHTYTHVHQNKKKTNKKPNKNPQKNNAVALVVVRHPSTGKYLAVEEQHDKGWWLPAGHVDPNETFAQVKLFVT